MSLPRVYLDHNATTPVRAEAVAAVMVALALSGNASSMHADGRSARAQLNEARDRIAAAIGLPAGGRIVFTSGATEANHLALRGTGRALLRSAIEHDSVRAAVPGACPIPVDAAGCVDLSSLESLLVKTEPPVLLSVMAANNETGVVQPLTEVVRLARASGALVHCDAVQAIGKVPFDMGALGLDLVSISGHKLGGPQGVGALAIGPGVDLAPLQQGGGQEGGMRAGTENLPGICGFAVALEAAVAELESYAGVARLRDRLEAALVAAAPAATVIGQTSRRLPNTSCIASPGLTAEAQVIALDLAGISIGAGAACSFGKVVPSHVLAAMGLPPETIRGAIRISLGRTTGEPDIERCIEAWSSHARRAQRYAAA